VASADPKTELVEVRDAAARPEELEAHAQHTISRLCVLTSRNIPPSTDSFEWLGKKFRDSPCSLPENPSTSS